MIGPNRREAGLSLSSTESNQSARCTRCAHHHLSLNQRRILGNVSNFLRLLLFSNTESVLHEDYEEELRLSYFLVESFYYANQKNIFPVMSFFF